MKNISILAMILLSTLLSGCQMSRLTREDVQSFRNNISRKYPIGSDENILIKDLINQGYRYKKRDGQIDGIEGWQDLQKHKNNGILPSLCLNEYHVTWLADNNGKIAQAKAYAYSDCGI